MFLGIRNKFWFLAVVIITASNAFADTEHFYNSISGVHFAVDSSVITMDDKFLTPLWSTIQYNLKAVDVVTLEMNEDTSLFLAAPENCTVDVEITFINQYNVADSFATSLSIGFDTNRAKPFNYRTSFKFTGGYSVKTRILAVHYSGGATYPGIFTLAEDIYINRIYKFNCDSVIVMSSCSYDATNQRLDLSWSPYLGADYYDLEFTYYDHLSQLIAESFSSPSYSNLNFIFQGNATRVTLNDFSYSISLIYDTGYVFYRVRPIHYDSSGNRIEGTWSSDIALNPNIALQTSTIAADPDMFAWEGHEPNLNWQYTAAYAEEGKRKEVTSYFDGTLRNRQSVTLNNTENKAIVGETMYDHQGRAAVTTLPAPIDSGKIVFYDLYNVNMAGKEYSRWDFDTGGCSFIPPGMDSVLSGVGRGSSGYYSSSNPDVNTGFNAYLPDAQAYPFTETQYTSDNTGRISSQSIAGKTYTLGSGHETKYFYGNPSQEQLDRLFGNEVGDNSHYLENMVIDANGQISVSYVDANGKTVATALAGQPPFNLSPLPSYYPADSLTVNLLNGMGNTSGNSISNSYGLLATNQGRYFFSYKLLPDDYTDNTCSESPICDDCLYDVLLMVTDGCGADPPLIIKHDTNFTYASAHPFDTTCNNKNIIDTFSLYLSPGNYNITRIITVDNGAISYYTGRYLSSDSCLQTYEDFYNTAVLNTDFTGCGMDCQTCLASLGADTTFVRKYIAQIIGAGGIPTHSDTLEADSTYTSAIAQCDLLCQPYNPCLSLYDQMLADVSLGGQYCTYEVTGLTDTATSTVSVLNYEPSSIISNYQEATNYVNSNNVADTVFINGTPFLPSQLSINDFVQNWNPSWAQALVQFHPEYCYYKYCQMDTASNRYDYDMQNTNSFAAAYSAGFLNPVGDGGTYGPSVWNDPYFASGGLGYDSLSEMQNYLTNFVTITTPSETLNLWQAAALSISCEIDTLSNLPMTYTTPMFGGGCAGNNNMEWDFFRGVYMAKKQAIQNSLENVYVQTSGCSAYAACIGQTTGAPCSGTSYDTMHARHYTEANMNVTSCQPPAGMSQAEWYNENVKSECDTVCRSYAYAWYESLDSCGHISSTDSTLLIAGLELVCETGCNGTHPTGSSNTPNYATDALGDRDFEDVITRVLGTARTNIYCDSLNISMPLPYIDSNGITGPAITFYKPSECICSRLDSLLAHYKPDSLSEITTYHNFADYLNKNFGGNLADSTVYSLMGLCNSSTCFFLQNPVQLPIWLTCCSDTLISHTFDAYNSSHVLIWDTTVNITQGCCIKCTDIEAGMRIFQEVSPPGVDTLISYQTLLTNFLNNLYGFNLSYSQYIQYDTTCEAIHCCWSISYWLRTSELFAPQLGATFDSTCGGITVIDSSQVIVSGSDTTYDIFYRKITGAPTDSIPLTLCNEPILIPPPVSDTDPCLSQLLMDAGYNAANAYNQYLDSITNAFTENYIAHCMEIDDSFHLNMPFNEYHYTLYYYDQAENLVKTIPPQGVHPITSPATLAAVANYRAGSGSPVYPTDSLASRYWFNTLNSPVQQNTPDGDTARFWYDRLGRLVLSQNAVQKPYLYSYTEYDPIGRIIEVGQMNIATTNYVYTSPALIGHEPDTLLNDYITTSYPTDSLITIYARNDSALNFLISNSFHTQITHTYYDSVAFPHLPLIQNNLRKRISTITYQQHGGRGETLITVQSIIVTAGSPPHVVSSYVREAFCPTDADTVDYDNAIHYTYDIEGNVASMVMDDKNDSTLQQRYKRADYFYDLVSGKVNQIDYQRNQPDFFMQAYTYDADNRITDVQTSSDSINWTEEANYQYYWHGPLAREVIGRRQVQGVDYAYTINGWIKGVNSSLGASMQNGSTYDMGHDGDVNDPTTATIGRDAYGFTLNYFNGDYRPIGGKTFEATLGTSGMIDTSLYNGNIAAATYTIQHLLPKTMGWIYHYDQLNRYLRQQGYTTPDTVLNNWSTGVPTPSMAERTTYDENGNILTYVRHGNAIAGKPLAMDSLTYHYNKGTNQLAQVNDAVGATNYPNDIDNETSKRNYRYNAIGQLAKDSSAGLDTITWTVYGKVWKVVKTNGDSIVFDYDPLGNRLEKRDYRHHDTITDTANYARDAQGNILAIYKRQRDSIWLNEFDIYGSKRIGVIDTTMLTGVTEVTCSCTPLANPFDSSRIGYLEGQRRYELDNHLGNVLVTVDDRKLPFDTTGTPNQADFYWANTINAQDYYPFGMAVPGRSYSLATDSSYRYAFNGKLHDDDIYGKDNSYDYGKRFYDPRLGRFMSVDPIAADYPELSTYQYASLNPIVNIDIDGLEGMPAMPIYNSEKFLVGYTSPTDVTAVIPPRAPEVLPPHPAESSTNTAVTAQQIIDTKNVKFATVHPDPPKGQEHDNATASDNIKQAAAGHPMQTSQYGHAEGAKVPLNKKAGEAFKELAEKYKMSVSEVAGGKHKTAGSYHYKGSAFDVNVIGGERVTNMSQGDKKNFIQAAHKAGFTYVADEGSHIHMDYRDSSNQNKKSKTNTKDTK